MILHLDSSVGKSGDAWPVDSAGAGGSGRSAAGAAGQDSIQISGASNALNRLATDRAAHIQQLTAAVQSGSYSVPGAAIARAMVAQSLPAES